MTASEGSVRTTGNSRVTIVLEVAAVAIIGLMAYVALQTSSVPVRSRFTAMPAPIAPPGQTLPPSSEPPLPLASCHSLLTGTDVFPADAGPPDDGSDNSNSVCAAHRQHLMIIELWLCAALLMVLFGLYRLFSTPKRSTSDLQPATAGVD